MSNYSKYLLLTLRIVFGLMFLVSGIDKLTSNFTAAGYLTNVSTGPFRDMYISLAGSPIVDFMVVWGEILIGLALVLGILVRLSCYLGSIMMLMYYLSVLPPEHGYISQHIIYVLVFAILASFAAGRVWGLDQLIERQRLVKLKPIIRLLLG